ncbi:MAG TPA: OstA-like protein [Ignavibacteria bacterium]|nr:OstA-like protein [Ignavibacteria bacterium]HMQ98764.1 OstA-like protein [Ignavibacteria bacterium]
MRHSALKLLAIVFLTFTLYGQDKITINHADSLVGKTIDGEQVREAVGNVSLTHNNVNITCSRVIQYYNLNKADLYGNVKVVQDTLTILAPQGTYYGNESKVVCPAGATLMDPKTTLKANYGVYLFSQDLANFRGNVRITDNRTYTITSDELDYYRNVQKSYARGDVKVVSDSSVIYSDNLVYEKLIGLSTATGNVKIESDSTIITSKKAVYYEFEKKSIAEENVKIDFLTEDAVVYGNYAENYETRNYSFVKGKARLIQIENKDGKTDTTFIFSEKMESFRNKPEHYAAYDSVKTIRNDFLSVSQAGYYFRDLSGKGGVISLAHDPVVWKEDLQVSGDSIYAYFKDDVDDIYINRSAFALQQNDIVNSRYDQISGIFMHIKFLDNQVNYIQVDTNAASIYFVYDSYQPNGANRSAGDVIKLFFKEKKVDKVNIFGKPKGTYFPENLVNTDELRLLGFRLRSDKPVRITPSGQ